MTVIFKMHRILKTVLLACFIVFSVNIFAYSEDIKPIPDDPVGKPLTKDIENFILNKDWCSKVTNGVEVKSLCRSTKVKGSIYHTKCTYKTKNLTTYWSVSAQGTMLSNNMVVWTYSDNLPNGDIQWYRVWGSIDYKNNRMFAQYGQIQSESNGVWTTVKQKSPPEQAEVWELCE